MVQNIPAKITPIVTHECDNTMSHCKSHRNALRSRHDRHWMQVDIMIFIKVTINC